MKKLYTLGIALLGLGSIAMAQCTITSGPTITVNGLTITVTATGTGASQPAYVWDWGDASNPGVLQNDQHTYADTGTYLVCVVYADQMNPFTCNDSACATVVITAVGVSEVNTVNSISTSPNPFGASTVFEVNLVNSADVEISVYDIAGKKVETVKDGEMNAGKSQIVWSPENLAEGVYFVEMVIDGAVTTKRIVHTTNQ